MQTVFKVALAIGEPVNLLSIQELMSVKAMVKAVRRHAKTIPNADSLLSEVVDQGNAENEGIEGLRALIRNLARSSAAHLFDVYGGAPVLQLDRARDEGAVAYFALPALTFPDLSKALGKLVINDARNTLSQRDGPWLIVLDEISTFVGQQVLNLVNQGRSYGARVVLSGQSFADLEVSVLTGGTSFLNQVLASVNTLIVHQLNSPTNAELASQYSGTFQKVEVTAQVVEGVATGVGSARSSREFVVSPDDFKELKMAESYLISKKYGTKTKISGRLSRISQIKLPVSQDTINVMK
ncbi:MAG: TraM recognition domain-containing protein [Devosia sp.]|nr:TraM recognition domain-containing protein [Devosia sp.]